MHFKSTYLGYFGFDIVWKTFEKLCVLFFVEDFYARITNSNCIGVLQTKLLLLLLFFVNICSVNTIHTRINWWAYNRIHISVDRTQALVLLQTVNIPQTNLLKPNKSFLLVEKIYFEKLWSINRRIGLKTWQMCSKVVFGLLVS